MTQSALFTHLTPEQFEALKGIVASWIEEGYTTPPYTDAQYDIFESLGLDEDNLNLLYDTRRPGRQ